MFAKVFQKGHRRKTSDVKGRVGSKSLSLAARSTRKTRVFEVPATENTSLENYTLQYKVPMRRKSVQWTGRGVRLPKNWKGREGHAVLRKYMKRLGLGGIKFAVLGAGAYGVTVATRVTPVLLFRLSALSRRLRNVINTGRTPPLGSVVVLKFGFNESRRMKGFKEFIAASIRESKVHYHVSTSCAKISCFERKVCGGDLAATMYFAGSDNYNGVWITVMEKAPGAPLASYLKKKKMTPRLYLLLERSLALLLYKGVVHADMHQGNIMLGKGGRVTMIDWGFAIMLHPQTRQRVRSFIDGGGLKQHSLGDMYSILGLRDYAIRVLNSRDYQNVKGAKTRQLNLDYRLLNDEWSSMSSKQRLATVRLRKRMWNCGGKLAGRVGSVKKQGLAGVGQKLGQHFLGRGGKYGGVIGRKIKASSMKSSRRTSKSSSKRTKKSSSKRTTWGWRTPQK